MKRIRCDDIGGFSITDREPSLREKMKVWEDDIQGGLEFILRNWGFIDLKTKLIFNSDFMELWEKFSKAATAFRLNWVASPYQYRKWHDDRVNLDKLKESLMLHSIGLTSLTTLSQILGGLEDALPFGFSAQVGHTRALLQKYMHATYVQEFQYLPLSKTAKIFLNLRGFRGFEAIELLQDYIGLLKSVQGREIVVHFQTGEGIDGRLRKTVAKYLLEQRIKHEEGRDEVLVNTSKL